MIPDSLVIKVITLRRDTSNLPIVKQLRALFPDIPVTIQPGVDVTSLSTQELYEQDKIGIVGVLGLQRDSRKWHEDLPGPGAVGCFHAHKNALQNTDGPLLLLEDDCVLQPTFKQAFYDLFERNDFDVAVFGAHIKNSYPDAHTRNSSEKRWDANKTYWNHHCVYYTDRARRVIVPLLSTADIQIDAHISTLGALGKVRIIVTPEHATQTLHLSSIQEHVLNWCWMCEMNNRRILCLIVCIAILGAVCVHRALCSRTPRYAPIRLR